MYRTIDCSTWGDPWFEELKPHGKLLFLYLVTTQRQTNCGAFQISTKTLAYETGLSATQLTHAIGEVCNLQAGKVVWWPEFSVLWVRNFFKHQRAASSEKLTVSARKALETLPKAVALVILETYPELYPTDTLPIPYKEPTDRSSAITEHNITITEHNIASTETGETGASALASVPKTKPAPKERTAKRPAPERFEITDAMWDWAGERVPQLDIDQATDDWLDYCRSKSERFADWTAAWRRAMSMADKWRLERLAKSGNGKRESKTEATERWWGDLAQRAKGLDTNGDDRPRLLSTGTKTT